MLDKSTNLMQHEPDESLDSIAKVHQLIIDIEMQITRIEWLRLSIASLLNTDKALDISNTLFCSCVLPPVNRVEARIIIKLKNGKF